MISRGSAYAAALSTFSLGPCFRGIFERPARLEVCAVPGKNYRFFKKKLLGSFDERALRAGILQQRGIGDMNKNLGSENVFVFERSDADQKTQNSRLQKDRGEPSHALIVWRWLSQ